MRVIGKSVVRTDAVTKAMGKAIFFNDIKLPGTLYMKVFRSPYPHARIVQLDVSKAKSAPGVRCVVTSKDAPQRRYSTALIEDQTVLAGNVVRYIGEPIAAVAADTPEAAEEATRLIDVVLDELPHVFDPEEAMSVNPPTVIHQDFINYKGIDTNILEPDRPNVFSHIKIRKGDVEKGFKESALVLENKFSLPPIQHCPMETHGVVVRPDDNGGLTFWTGRQGLWNLKGLIADYFGIQPSKIRVIQQYVGGAFGSKIMTIEIIAALVALKSRRPIKWVLTREEEFIDGGRREPLVAYIKDGVKEDGTIVSREMKVILGAGAYDRHISIVTKNCSHGAIATYKIPNLKWDSYGVYTNEPPACAFRGFGVDEIVFVIESHMDMLAERLGISPIEIRKKNILHEGEQNARGEIVHSIGVKECIDKICEHIDLNKKPAREGVWRKGRGIAIGGKYSTGMAMCQAKIKINEDETFVVYHSADEIGQGCNTIIAQIVAEEFGVSVEEVQVVFSDTSFTPFFGEGSTSSRTTFQLGNAVRDACRNAKWDLFQKASSVLKTPAQYLALNGKHIFVIDDPNKKIRIKDLFHPFRGKAADIYGGVVIGGEIVGFGTRIQDFVLDDPNTGQIDPILAAGGKRLNSHYTYIAKAVEVAVNIETGQVKVLRCIGVSDLGKVLNGAMCEQQSEGGLVMGIGSALLEEIIMDKGLIKNGNLHDYKIPSIGDVPKDIVSVFVESAPHKDGPYGAKGLGEAAMIGTEPAIANAVYNAVGVRVKNLPLSSQKILESLGKL